MPTAEKFHSLGAGNGFASCLEKFNVSDYNFWSILNGTNKTNFTETSELDRRESLILAMKLYWNLYGFTGEFSKSDNTTDDAPAGDYNLTALNSEKSDSDFTYEPFERVCFAYRFQYFLKINVWASIQIVELYDGSVSVEDNFIGYGVREFLNPDAFLRIVDNSTSELSVNAQLNLTFGFEDGVNSGPGEPDWTQGAIVKYDYASLTNGSNTFHFVCEARSNAFPNNTSVTETIVVEPENIKVEASRSRVSDPIESASIKMHVTGFEFYDYT